MYQEELAYPIIVSFSGGRTSAYMLRLLLDNYAGHPIHVVYANTGQERHETLDFVHACSTNWGVPIVWVEALVHAEKGVGTGYRVVDYHTAARPPYGPQPVGRPADWAHPFEATIAKYGIPNKQFPHCSRELKLRPINAWVAEHVGKNHEMAIGIRYDELDRAKAEWYPLITWRVTKETVRRFWDEQPFDLELKDYQGNCDLCWKKSLRKNATILEEQPAIADWWIGQEAKMHDANLHGKGGAWKFHHGGMSTPAMLAFAQRGKFQRAHDEHLLATKDVQLDYELSCSCGLQ